MKLGLALLACVLLSSCKTDPPAPAAGSADNPTSATTGRSGKIDLPRQRPGVGTATEGSGDESPRPGLDPSRSREESRERPQEMRRQRQVDLDANGDGTITPEEVKAGQLRRADEMHEQFDADGDGKLTVAEMEQTRAARWMDPVTLDGDKNGEISSEEIRASMEQRRQRMRDARAGSSGGLQGPGEASGTP